MSNMLVEGNEVTIRVKNILWDRRHLYAPGVVTQEYNVYSGTIVRQKWFAADEIGITTGNTEFPFRRINRDRIVEVNDLPVNYAKPVETARIEKVIAGSKGNSYIVAKEGNKVTCTCPGFTFRGQCKHMLESA